jgi:hypothetical protein
LKKKKEEAMLRNNFSKPKPLSANGKIDGKRPVRLSTVVMPPSMFDLYMVKPPPPASLVHRRYSSVGPWSRRSSAFGGPTSSTKSVHAVPLRNLYPTQVPLESTIHRKATLSELEIMSLREKVTLLENEIATLKASRAKIEDLVSLLKERLTHALPPLTIEEEKDLGSPAVRAAMDQSSCSPSPEKTERIKILTENARQRSEQRIKTLKERNVTIVDASSSSSPSPCSEVSFCSGELNPVNDVVEEGQDEQQHFPSSQSILEMEFKKLEKNVQEVLVETPAKTFDEPEMDFPSTLAERLNFVPASRR